MSKIIAPASKPQELFLNLRDGTGKRSKWATEEGEEVDIVFYGGQAGGGKSFASLMHHLKYIHIPYYKGIIIRRTTPMLTKAGAIWDEAKALYKEVDSEARIRNKDMKINLGPIKELEKKAEVSFTHFERVDDTANFQGSQLSSAVLDELTQFEESQFLYILSRLRTKAAMKPVLRATMNPAPDSWVRKWVDWYLYGPEHGELFGRPDPAKQAVVRWFIRNGNDMVWGESRQEMFEKYGRLDENGVPYPEDHPRQIKPLSFAFISASVYDNPYIEPNYIAFLEGLGRVDKEILLYGSWEARPEGNGYWKREWCEEITAPVLRSEVLKTVRAYDLAGSIPSEINKDCDYSVGVKMDLLKNGTYVITDVFRFRARYGEVEKKIIETAHEDGMQVDIIVPRDPGQAGQAAAQLLAKTITNEGFYCKMKPSSKSKVDRFRPFAAASENGLVKIVKNCCDDLWNNTYNDNSWFYNEMEVFDGGRKGHDDAVDAVSSAHEALSVSIRIPTVVIPGMSKSNPFNISS